MPDFLFWCYIWGCNNSQNGLLGTTVSFPRCWFVASYETSVHLTDRIYLSEATPVDDQLKWHHWSLNNMGDNKYFADMDDLCTGPMEWVGYNNYRLSESSHVCHENKALLMCKELCLETNNCRSLTYNHQSSTCCLNQVNQWQVALVVQTGLDYHEYFNTTTGKLVIAQYKTVVSPLLTHWRYCSLALRHCYGPLCQSDPMKLQYETNIRTKKWSNNEMAFEV